MGMLSFLKKKDKNIAGAPEMPDLMTEDFNPPPENNPAMPPQPFNMQDPGLPPAGTPLPPPNFNPNSADQLGTPQLGPQMPPQNPMQQVNPFTGPPQTQQAPSFPEPSAPRLPPPTMPNIPTTTPSLPEPPAPTTEDIPIQSEPVAPSPNKDSVTIMSEDIEQIAENIIEEKFEALNAEVQKFEKWKTLIDTKVGDLSDSVKKIDARVSDTQKSIMTKVSDYNKSIKDVDVELKALTKVFEKVMPTFTTNVKELSKIVTKTKRSQAKKV
jgi:uncharacterized protein YoxC